MARLTEPTVDHAQLAMRAAAFDRLGASAVVLDGDGIIRATNESWRLFTRLNDGDPATTGPGADYLGACDRAATAGAAGASQVAREIREILAGDRLRMDFEYPCPSAVEDRWFLLRASAAPVADGTGVIVFHIDITARKLLTDRLTTLAEDDALTGLPNRRSAIRYLGEQLSVAARAGGSVWVYFIDLNGFKEVNDRHGHHVGDELLCKVAIRVRRALRAEDHLCRFGGDEFVLICPGLDPLGAASLADRLRTVMFEPFQIGDVELPGTVAVGFAQSQRGSTVDSMLRNADEAMYADKRAPARRPPRRPAHHRAMLEGGGAPRIARRQVGPTAPAASVAGPAPGTGSELLAQGRRLAVLAQAQRAIASPMFDAGEVAARVAQWALALSDADGVTLEVRDGDQLVCQSAIGALRVPIGSRRAVGGSVAGACMSSGKPSAWAGIDQPEELAVASGIRSGVVVPLVASDDVPALGVLTVVSERARPFGDHDILGLEVIAGIAGGFLAKAALLQVLERTAARYRTLVDHLPGTAVMVFDQQLCLLVVAGPGARLWRYAERNVAPGVFLAEIVSPEELAILEPFYRSALLEPGTLEYYSAETGLDFHFAAVPIPNVDGDVDQLLVTVTDVTQVKADQEALLEAETRYRTAFEEGPVGMTRTTLSGRFEATNQAFCELTGYTLEQLQATTFVALVHRDEAESARAARASMIEGLTDGYRTERRLVRADGQDLWVALSSAIVRDAETAHSTSSVTFSTSPTASGSSHNCSTWPTTIR